MINKYVQDFIILFAAIDPFGTLSIFIGLTARYDPAQRDAIARRAVLYATGILLGFVVVGQLILTAMDIELSSFQIAGGAILFVFGLQMIFSDTGQRGSAEQGHDVAVFPLAMPSLANPGAMLAVVLLTDNHRFSIGTQVGTSLIMVLILAFTYGLLRFATPIHRFIGFSGAAILERVMGVLLAALAVENVIQGVRLVLAGN